MKHTTKADAARPADLVGRRFGPTAPNPLWGLTAATVRGAEVKGQGRSAFTFGLRVDGYDRRAELTRLELDTVIELAPVRLRHVQLDRKSDKLRARGVR